MKVTSYNGCGTVVRQAQSSRSSQVNKLIEKATGNGINYSAGQPEYVGTARCDPAKAGAVNPQCCQ